MATMYQDLTDHTLRVHGQCSLSISGENVPLLSSSGQYMHLSPPPMKQCPCPSSGENVPLLPPLLHLCPCPSPGQEVPLPLLSGTRCAFDPSSGTKCAIALFPESRCASAPYSASPCTYIQDVPLHPPPGQKCFWPLIRNKMCHCPVLRAQMCPCPILR